MVPVIHRVTLDDLRRVRRWRDDAGADGWDITPTYKGTPTATAATLKRDGWVALTFTRIHDNGFIEASLHLWGPDRLQVVQPEDLVYDWAKLQRSLHTCLYCLREDVPVRRVNFAGRVCDACHPAIAAETEKPGWAD
jgi:hypothetical protein